MARFLVASLLATSAAITGAIDGPVLYDCHVGYEYWQVAWTPDWKDWCCEHEQRGCPETTTETVTETKTVTMTTTKTSTTITTTKAPPTTTTLPTTTPATTRKPSEACQKECVLSGTKATCQHRLLFAAKYGEEREAKDPCRSAAHSLHAMCSVCLDCLAEESGCDVPVKDGEIRIVAKDELTESSDALVPTPSTRALPFLAVIASASLLLALFVLAFAWTRGQRRRLYSSVGSELREPTLDSALGSEEANSFEA